MSVKKVLLVLGGEPPDEDSLLWRVEDADISIAVDAGWLVFRHAQILPNLLIGDLDSWGGENKSDEIPEEVELIEDNNQDRTDFQKALDYLNIFPSLSEIVILGGLGNRTDHLLTNFLIACAEKPELIVIFDSEKEWVRRVTSKTPLKIIGQEGAALSLVPFSFCESVSSVGLKWEITKQDLSSKGSFSQSNLCLKNEACISLSSGNLLVILQK